MKNILKLVFLLGIIISLSACSIAGPLMITDNPGGKGSKVGEVSYTQILFFRPMSVDLSIMAAAKKGKITKISTVDYKVTSGFLTAKYSIIVTGE
jgi:hypothetical protein